MSQSRNWGHVPLDVEWPKDEPRDFFHYHRVWLDRDGWSVTQPGALLPQARPGADSTPRGAIYALCAVDHVRKVAVYKEVLA